MSHNALRLRRRRRQSRRRAMRDYRLNKWIQKLCGNINHFIDLTEMFPLVQVNGAIDIETIPKEK